MSSFCDDLERVLKEIGEEDGETLLAGLLARSEAPSLRRFVGSRHGLGASSIGVESAHKDDFEGCAVNPGYIYAIPQTVIA